MRISEHQRRVIVESVRQVFGADATVRLFGSRADDSKKGGDIDLYVETSCTDGVQKMSRDFLSRELYSKICTELGEELPIDLIVKTPSMSERLIHRSGRAGISL